MTRVEGYATVRIGSRSSVFEVALDDAAHSRKLAADLVVAAREELYLHEMVALGGAQVSVAQSRKLGFAVTLSGLCDERLVHLLVADQPILQQPFLLRRSGAA